MRKLWASAALLLTACASAPVGPSDHSSATVITTMATPTKQEAKILAIPCVLFPAPLLAVRPGISWMAYSVPPRGDNTEAYRKWQAGTLPDPKNKWDTPVTVGQITRLNVIIEALCRGGGQ